MNGLRSRWVGRTLTLDQRANGAGIAFALDEVSLPVPGQLAILNFWRAHMDAQQIGDLPTPILAFGAGPAFGARHAQAEASSSFLSSPRGWA